MEHLHHFGLSQDPFSNEPDLRFYFESATHRDAQRRVERGLRQQKGLTLLTGEGGMGKTLLARRILDSLEEEVFEATLLVMLPGAADATGILQRFARQLGCEEPMSDRAGLLGQIYEQLAIVREDGRHAVLMVDDAQIMTPEVFAELGGLLNLEYEDRRLISMLLVGSGELDALVQNDLSIMPRVDVRVRLQPLDMQDATIYLNHRLGAVNGNPKIIPHNAIEALYKFGRGRPRLLNTLADNALFEAYLSGRPAIDPSDVERAAADLGIGPDPGATYSPVSSAPVPPAVPPVGSPAAVENLSETPAPGFVPEAELQFASAPIEMDINEDSLELDDPVSGFDLAPETELAQNNPATIDLDAGLEAALEDFVEPQASQVSPASEVAVEPVAKAPSLDVLEFEVEPVAAGPVIEAIELEDEPEFVMAEAELSPLGADEADEFDDIFVELIEE